MGYVSRNFFDMCYKKRDSCLRGCFHAKRLSFFDDNRFLHMVFNLIFNIYIKRDEIYIYELKCLIQNDKIQMKKLRDELLIAKKNFGL